MSTSGNELPFGQRIGVFILAEISAISASSVIILLGYIAYSAVTIRRGAKRRWKLTSPVHLFLLNQLVCDLIQALGGMMNMKWMIDGTIDPGAFCTTQGLIKQLADVGTALSAGNVAIYTFSTLIFRLRPDTNLLRAVIIVAGIWIAIILNVAINIGVNGASRFYGPAGPWCWITEEFHVQRTVADFLWMWISAFSSVLAYVAVFLVLRGFIVVEGWRVRWAPKHETPTIPQSHTLAYKMLAYPIIYIITVLPLAAARYNDFTKDDTPFGFLVLADGLYLSSGFLNVVLYWYTRPYLLPNRAPVDTLDDQSFVLRSESPNGQIQPPSFSNNRASFMDHKSAASVYESSEMAPFRHQDGPLTASLGHDHKISRDEATGGYTTNIDDDI